MVIGHSEGGIAAARVANRMHQKVNYVCIMAGEGPSQLYSLYTFARSGEFFSEKGATDQERTDFVVAKWYAIIQSPYSTDKYFWGFTYLRWYSFLSTSVIDELSQYKGSVLILQGEQDKNVNPETAVIAYASLLSKGVDVTLKMYPGADHSFYIKSGNGNGWETALKDALNWFF